MLQQIVNISSHDIENPDRELVSFEYIEALVRVAATRIRDNGMSLSSKLDSLLNDYVKKNADWKDVGSAI